MADPLRIGAEIEGEEAALAVAEALDELAGAVSSFETREPASGEQALWRVEAFRNYADYAETSAFQEALARLETLAAERPTAIMCAEALWWQCHRRLITDYMLTRGWRVIHLMAPGQRQDAILTPGAVPQRDGTIAYLDERSRDRLPWDEGSDASR